MKKTIFFFVSLIIIVILSSACKKVSTPVATMNAFMNAMATKDSNLVSQLSSPEFAQTAQEMVDSFSSVDLSLNDLSCTEKENSGENALVNCTGTLITSYNGENSEIDLSLLDYQLQKINGDWLISGQQ